jgi:hypothetical protein
VAYPANALQAAIYTRLTSYTPLTTALGGARVFDHVPQNQPFPYVVLGDDTLVDWSTKTNNGWEATLTLHCWDRPKAGRKSVKTILGHLYDALHRQEASVTVTGFQLVLLQCEFQQTFQETAVEGDNDHFYHGVMRFRALIQ